MFYMNAKITLCKYRKQSVRNKIKKTNNNTKVVVGAYLSRKEKGGLYNTYHELLIR